MDSKIGKKVLWSSEIVSLTKLLVADGPDISNYTQCELTAAESSLDWLHFFFFYLKSWEN